MQYAHITKMKYLSINIRKCVIYIMLYIYIYEDVYKVLIKETKKAHKNF